MQTNRQDIDNFNLLLKNRHEQALASGALQAIQTDPFIVADAGLNFELRKISTIKSKKITQAAKKQKANFDPFAKPDLALKIMNVGPTYSLLFNKFPVFRQHLLLVTRRYVSQIAPLNFADFFALSRILQKTQGLAFYNAGPQAGASQKHKHLQIIPAQAFLHKQVQQIFCCPLAALLHQQKPNKPHFAAFDFAHYATAFNAKTQAMWSIENDCENLATTLYHFYRTGLGYLGMNQVQPDPYNLCISKRGLLLVPRRQDEVRGISLNALAYAGFFLARDDEELNIMRQHGPLRMLREAATDNLQK